MKIIACYSSKGGVGKTATAVNLAYAFAADGVKTLLCDLDAQGASSYYFRVKPSKKLEDESFFKDQKRFTKAIRGTDFDNLDIVPSNMSFRDFDVFLSRMKNSRSRLKKALKAAGSEYDVILLDCPPNISKLSENVFRASDCIVVPVIPTTLSERTFDQLMSFFRAGKFQRKKIFAFFSMEQRTKKLHRETLARMRKSYPKRFLETTVPFASVIEKMGVHRAPVATYAPNSSAARAYHELYRDVSERLK